MIQFLTNIQDDILEKEVSFFDDYHYTGSYNALVSSKSIWYNGATYMTSQRSVSSNNAPAVIKWKDDVLEYGEVGVIEHADPLQHVHPALLIIDGFIYIFATNGHGYSLIIWKSNVAESVTDGFTLHHTIAGNIGYCNPRMLEDGRVAILSRYTLFQDSKIMSQVMFVSDIDDLTNWEEIQMTDANFSISNIRHYPSFPFHYETNAWNYIGISLRKETVNNYFGHAVYKTQDFITFYSLDETFSKNIVVNGEFTESEIETNLMILGTNTDTTVNYQPLEFIVINDTLYSYYYDESISKYYYMKTDNLGNSSTVLSEITGFRILYNGTNLVLRAKSMYACDFDFGNIKELEKIIFDGEEYSITATLLPTNLNEVEGNYIFGGYMGTTNGDLDGILPYYITSDKFKY